MGAGRAARGGVGGGGGGRGGGLLALAGGAGVALYVFWWLTVPTGDPLAARDEQRPASLSRLAPRLQGSVRRLPVRDVAIGVVLLGGAALLVALRTGVDVEVSWVIPVLIALAGAALAWSQLDAVERGRLLTRAVSKTQLRATSSDSSG